MGTSFLWLEVTGKCPLSCRHCYADSGPSGTHGSMTRSDWHRVLGEAVELRVEMVQFIGGEPTLYPDLVPLIEYALARGLAVEVFSNLVHVTNEMWDVFSRPRVSLATSYYSDDPAQHAAVTGRPSYTRTKANIAEAVRRGIPLRAGVIDLGDGQRADAAQAELVELGVPSVGYDRVRQVGRGVRDRQASTEQLCGQCGDDVAAISPTARSGHACFPAGCRSATSSTTPSPRSWRATRLSGFAPSWRRRSRNGLSPATREKVAVATPAHVNPTAIRIRVSRAAPRAARRRVVRARLAAAAGPPTNDLPLP